MPREHEPPLVHRQFILEALKEGVRLDGRGLLDTRKVGIEFGSEYGKVEVRYGKTRVYAQVSASIIPPREDRPYEGILVIHSEIGSMASGVFENGRPSEEETLLTRHLEKSLRRSEALDREALCILAGERVWQVRLTIHVLADEGNVLDCAVMAGMAGLRHFRRGEVEVVGQDVILYDPGQREPVPLSIHHTPLSVTFAYFDNLLIIDPDHQESLLSIGTLTLTCNAQRELCVLNKAGGTPLDQGEVMRVIKLGVERVRELSGVLEEALRADEGRRRGE